MSVLEPKVLHEKMECDAWLTLTRQEVSFSASTWLHGVGWIPQMKMKVLWRREDRTRTMRRQPTKVYFHSYYHYHWLSWPLALGS